MGERKDRRVERTLELFEAMGTVRYRDLPPGVGQKTVEQLVRKGIVEIAYPGIGRYSKNFAWRLRRAD